MVLEPRDLEAAVRDLQPVDVNHGLGKPGGGLLVNLLDGPVGKQSVRGLLVRNAPEVVEVAYDLRPRASQYSCQRSHSPIGGEGCSHLYPCGHVLPPHAQCQTF